MNTFKRGNGISGKNYLVYFENIFHWNVPKSDWENIIVCGFMILLLKFNYTLHAVIENRIGSLDILNIKLNDHWSSLHG